MDMYNADGSRGPLMCGNGISAAVGKYVYDHGLTDKTVITVESGGAVRPSGSGWKTALSPAPGGHGRPGPGAEKDPGGLRRRAGAAPGPIDGGEGLSPHHLRLHGEPPLVVFVEDVDSLDWSGSVPPLSITPVFRSGSTRNSSRSWMRTR
jgi:diaminopimelate epimerase